MNLKYLIFLFIVFVFSVHTATAVTNGNMLDTYSCNSAICATGWTPIEGWEALGNRTWYGASVISTGHDDNNSIYLKYYSASSGVQQNMDLSGFTLSYWVYCNAGGSRVYVDGDLVQEGSCPTTKWYNYNINISGYTGVHTVLFNNPIAPLYYYLDNVHTDTSQMTGWITNNLGDSVNGALVSLNNSGGSTTSNETGYYSIANLSGTYTITVTSPTHEDYTESGISISDDVVKNITLTKLTPALSNVRILDKTKNYIWIGWSENAVVDSVKIFKDSENNYYTTKNTALVDTGSYKDENLVCGKGYSYWLQPLDGVIEGAKIRIDGKTDPCDGGGGSIAPSIPPVIPPDLNISEDIWINMSIEERQELINLTFLNQKPLIQNPYFTITWKELWKWMLLLLIILCAYISLDSITEQKWTEYTGLIAVIPGAYFAYLSGYFMM